MPDASRSDADGDLPPPGRRWGAGAQSVLPYLTRSLQARPSSAPEVRETRPREGNPVFENWTRPMAS